MFAPNYQYLVDAAYNRRPARLPLYEHHIDESVIMATVLQADMTRPEGADVADWQSHFEKVCRFWQEMTYDTVSFEGGICPILPGHGAILGGRPGPIQNREDFEKYPWDELPRLFWEAYEPQLAGLAAAMPPNMKAIGGCGYGVFEISEDLVGYEPLCMLQYDDPELYAELFVRIGDLMVSLWSELLRKYGDLFAVCRMGDDTGFKTSMLIRPELAIQHIIPQYRRIIDVVHRAGKPFLLHSCGAIFPIMDAVIEAGIDAKHSNEDQIAPFSQWIENYSSRIGLFGGIDVNVLCLKKPQEVFDFVLEHGREYRRTTQGYALGSGNSIPDYVPVDGFLAMIEAAQKIRKEE